MATTAYDYITLANLENYTGIDYSTVDSVAFHDDKVNAMIGIAERQVNAYKGVTAAQTITDSVISCVTVISAHILNENLKNLGYDDYANASLTVNIPQTLDFYLQKDYSPVDSIPMNAIDPRR